MSQARTNYVVVIFVFNGLRRYVAVNFVDISGLSLFNYRKENGHQFHQYQQKDQAPLNPTELIS